MRAQIADKATLLGIAPTTATAYLRAQGWTLATTEPDRFARYILPSGNGEPFEVDVPIRHELRDYALRLGEALRTLEIVENRSQLDIIRDMQHATVDAIRIAVSGAPTNGGRISLDAGASLFVQARELMLAAACATVEKRAVFAARKPAPAVDYVRRINFGPPSPGSFVVLIESPVAPRLQLTMGFSDDEPYERRVTLTLAQALEATQRAATLAAATGEARPFLEAVPQGVHANLCDVLAKILGETSAPASFQFSWSPARPVAPDVPRRIELASDLVQVLEEASRVFRKNAPRPDFELEGIPVKLSSPNAAEGGTVTIAGYVDASIRMVRVNLPATDYALAIRAHGAWLVVACEGELAREGTSFVLRNPRQFVLRETTDAGS